MRIARGTLLQGETTVARLQIGPLLPTFDEAGKHAEPVESLSMSTEHVLQSQETRAMVRNCIEQLPAQYREVILLRDINELDTAEVAAMLNITENAVKIRLHRARQALMTLLTQAQNQHVA